MKYGLPFGVLLLLSLWSCEKKSDSLSIDGMPDCMKEIVLEAEWNDLVRKVSSVYEWKVDEATYYFIKRWSYHGPYELYSEDCAFVCNPHGVYGVEMSCGHTLDGAIIEETLLWSRQ